MGGGGGLSAVWLAIQPQTGVALKFHRDKGRVDDLTFEGDVGICCGYRRRDYQRWAKVALNDPELVGRVRKNLQTNWRS